MKLYYAPGTCSLSPHIVALEAGIALDLDKVDLKASPHRTQWRSDYASVNPNGYVPALQLDDGSLLTENAAIVQYLADLAPGSGLAPLAGALERYRLQEWLSFVGTELHKMFSPWLFHPEYGAEAQAVARGKIAGRLGHLDRHLAEASFLMNETFTVADAYCFTVVGWSDRFGIDLGAWPRLADYMGRIANRPKVREAMAAHGVLPAAE